MNPTRITPPALLDYAAPKRRWTRRALGCVVVGLLVAAAINYRNEIRSFIAERADVYRLYSLQQSCIAESSQPGELILRTDGRTEGFLVPTTRRDYPGRPGFSSRFVTRDVQSVQSFQNAVRPIGVARRLRPFLGLNSTSVLVDCRRRQLSGGDEALAWVVIEPTKHTVLIRTFCTRAGTWRVPPVDDASLPSEQWTVRFPLTAGPLAIRRVVGASDQHVVLQCEQGTATTTIDLVWSGGGYSWASLPAADRYHEAALPIPTVEATTLKLPAPFDLSPHFSDIRDVAADSESVVIFGSVREGENDRFCVKRFHRATRRISAIDSARNLPRTTVLTRFGERTLSLEHGPESQLPYPVMYLSTIDLAGYAPAAFIQTNIPTYASPTLVACGDANRVVVNGYGLQTFDPRLVRTDRQKHWQFDRIQIIGQRLFCASTSAPTTEVFDLETKSFSGPIELPTPVFDARMSDDARRIFVSSQPSCVMDAVNGDIIAPLPADPTPSRDRLGTISPDGNWAVNVGGHGLGLLDIRKPSTPVHYTYPTHNPRALRVAFTPDSRHLVVVEATALSVIDLVSLVPDAQRGGAR